MADVEHIPETPAERRNRQQRENYRKRRATADPAWKPRRSPARTEEERAAQAERDRQRRREWRSENRERVKAYNAAWKQANRGYHAAWNRQQYATSLDFRERRKLSAAMLKRLRYPNSAKKGRLTELLGCTFADFLLHIERQFAKGMTWQNRGERWDIDHIRPLSSFDLSAPDGQRAAFHFLNLRPLWKEDNLRKRAHRTLLL